MRAVDGVSFTLERGKTLGVVGESGSGKTILSRSIMGLLPDPQRGADRQCEVRGHRGGRRRATPRCGALWGTEMAMVFQDPMTSLNPVMKVGNQITESLRHHLDMDKGEARETAIALLRSVGIPEPAQRVKEYPHQLSGGMRQRVMIAIALACGPRLLFADEPTTALDVTVQAQILDLLSGPADRAPHGDDPGHPRPRRRGRPGRRHRGDVRRQDRREGPDQRALLLDPTPVHRGPAEVDPQAGAHQPHPARRSSRGRPPDLVSPPEGCNFSPRCPYAQPKCFVEEPVLEAGPGGGHEFACTTRWGRPRGPRPSPATRRTSRPASAAGWPDGGDGTAHLRDPSETILRAEDLVVEFPVGRTGLKVHAVSGISIDVKEGETLGLVGESGCGKSTTGRALMQFPSPTGGQVTFEGEELTALHG